ncbi:MAG: hypothetical protein V3R28_02150 [Desulfatiglandales bacterium]
MRSKGILLALVIFSSLFGFQCEKSKTVPDELVGVWETSEPKYKDCYLELTEDLIIFANEAHLEKRSVNRVSKIEKTDRGKQVLYTFSFEVYYEDKKGQKGRFSFYYDPSEGGAIRFKNQLEIKWRKRD